MDLVAVWSQTNGQVLTPTTARLALTSLCRYRMRRGCRATTGSGGLESGERPRWEPKRTAILEGAELGALLEHADRFRPLFELLAFTGLRIGEALGCAGATSTSTAEYSESDSSSILPPPNAKSCSPTRSSRSYGTSKPSSPTGTPATSPPHRRRSALKPQRRRRRLPTHPPTSRPAGSPACVAPLPAGISDASLLIGGGLNVVFASRQLGHADITLGTYGHLYARPTTHTPRDPRFRPATTRSPTQSEEHREPSGLWKRA